MNWILLLLITLSALADSGPKEIEGFDAAADVIDEGIVAGSYLIYDCRDHHWTCVIKEDFDECRDQRASDLKAKKKLLSCSPIGEFPTKKSCFQRQLFLVGQNHGRRFCLSDEWKEREMF